MTSDDDFTALLQRVRRGEEDAATQLFERYHRVMFRTVSIRLENSALKATCDVDDICQTVFKSVFVRLRLGQYELKSGNDLVNLILRMAHNKVISRQRAQQARPDQANRAGTPGSDIGGRGGTPSQILSQRELLEKAIGLLSEEEQAIVKLRDDDHDWNAVAGKLGGTADGRRKQLERALARVAAELDLED
jgi:RNA polymerase sigma-70 factor (ECF subfamily)